MATLTGKKPSETYKDLLQISNSNTGIDTTERLVEDGEGTSSILKLSTTSVDIDNSSSNTFKLAGVTVTATATEINYTDGVTSSIQTQLNDKQPKIATAENSFVVGGSSANSVVNKTASEARTLLGMGTGYTLNAGTAQDNIVQHGASSSSDGVAHISSGKLISKSATNTRTGIGLGTSSTVNFGKVISAGDVVGTNMKMKLISSPLTANATNAGKLFYYSASSGNTRYRYLAMIIQTSLTTYVEEKIITKSWTAVAGE